MSVRVNALDHLVINVSDVARSTEWYRKILGMEVKVFDPGPGKTPRTSLVFGNQKINVRPRGADKVEWFTADHETAGSDDLCFLTSSTPDQVVAHLKANGVAIEEGPVAKQGARGTLRSVYCRDPDGSLIEISSYEDVRAEAHRRSQLNRSESEAIHAAPTELWIAASLTRLAMTAESVAAQ
jgi:catechol 2,3-dioxygenase-like lactoylglutathione lyase family enzyme